MPITAIASILHRLSGAFIFFTTPFLLYLFIASLKSNSGFALANAWLDSWWVTLLYLILIWAAVHHLLAGIRCLLLDLDIGVDCSSANLSAMLVTGLAVGLSVITIVWVL